MAAYTNVSENGHRPGPGAVRSRPYADVRRLVAATPLVEAAYLLASGTLEIEFAELPPFRIEVGEDLLASGYAARLSCLSDVWLDHVRYGRRGRAQERAVTPLWTSYRVVRAETAEQCLREALDELVDEARRARRRRHGERRPLTSRLFHRSR